MSTPWGILCILFNTSHTVYSVNKGGNFGCKKTLVCSFLRSTSPFMLLITALIGTWGQSIYRSPSHDHTVRWGPEPGRLGASNDVSKASLVPNLVQMSRTFSFIALPDCITWGAPPWSPLDMPRPLWWPPTKVSTPPTSKRKWHYTLLTPWPATPLHSFESFLVVPSHYAISQHECSHMDTSHPACQSWEMNTAMVTFWEEMYKFSNLLKILPISGGNLHHLFVLMVLTNLAYPLITSQLFLISMKASLFTLKVLQLDIIFFLLPFLSPPSSWLSWLLFSTISPSPSAIPFPIHIYSSQQTLVHISPKMSWPHSTEWPLVDEFIFFQLESLFLLVTCFETHMVCLNILEIIPHKVW